MRSSTGDAARKGTLAAVVVVALLILGSLIYWLGEGQPGSPEDFRQRVAEAGLSVTWSNSGPRGGSGVVDTACGAADVTVNDIDDQLWIRWGDRQALLSRETLDALLSCAP
jgi:hypothetical protein